MKATVQRIAKQTVEYLGEGYFSKVFRSVDNPTIVFIATPSNVPDKKILAQIDSTNTPKMISIKQFKSGSKEYTLWRTEYSKSLCKTQTAYVQAVQLDSLWRAFCREECNQSIKNSAQSHSVIASFIDVLKGVKDIEESIVNALTELYNAALQFSNNFWLEFQLHNLSVDSNGTLLLRDIIYFPEFL